MWNYKCYKWLIEDGDEIFVLQANNFNELQFNAQLNIKFHGKDEYGKSLICIIVDNKNRLKYATLRGNHLGIDNFFDNQYLTWADLSEAVGFNVKEGIINLPAKNNHRICSFFNY